MKIGIIADDYTGGTDAASFLVENGLRCIQLSGIQQRNISFDTDAIVVSLKSRTEPAEKAIMDSLKTYRWLKKQGCEIIQFKYCSTFDSTEKGNIGPVTDCILAEEKLASTIIVPSLPVNGRDVFYGNLYVKGEPLNESGMKDHPLTPMLDANISRLIEKQGSGKAGVIDFHIVEQGPQQIRTAFNQLTDEGCKYVIVDAFTDHHLVNIGEAFVDFPFLTGASGLSFGLGKALSLQNKENQHTKNQTIAPQGGLTVVISGSCSTQTNRQVNHYKSLAHSYFIDVSRLDDLEGYSDEIAEWFDKNTQGKWAPLISATVDKDVLSRNRKEYKFDVSSRIEHLFSTLVPKLQAKGCRNYICAGGETSGAVTQALNVDALRIGKLICPGVPWVSSLNGDIYLALKSGNFGGDNFFAEAQLLIGKGSKHEQF